MKRIAVVLVLLALIPMGFVVYTAVMIIRGEIEDDIANARFFRTMEQRRRPFSRDDWISPTNETMRIHMIEDLTSRYDLIGHTREELVSILGLPETSRAFVDFFKHSGWDLCYSLGADRRSVHSYMVEFLVLRLDTNNMVTAVDVRYWSL
jgi:hypothetical protein